MVICYWEEAEERETGGTEDGKTGETRKTPEDDGRRWTDDGRQTADDRTVSDPLAHARGHKAATDDGKAERLKAATLSSSSACQGTRLRGSADGERSAPEAARLRGGFILTGETPVPLTTVGRPDCGLSDSQTDRAGSGAATGRNHTHGRDARATRIGRTTDRGRRRVWPLNGLHCLKLTPWCADAALALGPKRNIMHREGAEIYETATPSRCIALVFTVLK
jgi:hypothetical protein